MKAIMKLGAAVVFSAAILACGSKSENTATEDYGSPEAGEAVKKTSADLIAEGASLVKASDCNTCHHATNKLVGPSHTEVAEKYEFTEENVKYLAEKIIKGGSGVWGEVVMNAHPDLNQVDAEKMARYVLSLDGEQEKE